MDEMMRPAGVTPMASATIARFMAVYDELCPTVDDEVPVEVSPSAWAGPCPQS